MAAGNVGNYRVIVSDYSGSVTSSVVTLTLLSPLVVSQPQSLIVSNGAPVSFSAAASGAWPLYFQWQKNGTNLTDAGNISGPTTTNLTLSAAGTNDAAGYTIIATNAYGCTTSSIAALAVVLLPSPAPTNQIIMAGSNVTFSISVAGTGPFNYQWQCNGTNLANNIITTIAGNGSNGFSGDGGWATNASLRDAEGVALDSLGNVFIADKNNNCIRKVDTNGIITTATTNASLFHPEGMAFDASGNMFIAVSDANQICKMDTKGIVTVFAGTGSGSYSGDNGPAIAAGLKSPVSVAFDAMGNLFITDYYNSRIRKVNAYGIITTVAGNGNQTYSGDGGPATSGGLILPSGIALDALGNFFIGEQGNNRVRKVDTNGIITTFAGTGTNGPSGDGGPATNASVGGPCGLAFDASGNLYIADSDRNRIRKVDTNGIITTVASGTNANLYYPHSVALDAAGNLFIADAFHNRIRKVSGLPTLTLQNVTAGNAGTYTVTVTSLSGSVTETIAVLTVLVPPNIQGFGQTNGVFNFTWAAVSNLSYQVQFTTNLATTNWVNLGSSITASNGTLSASDPIADVQRFYRVVLLQ